MHLVQQKAGLSTCGAVAFAAINEISELQAIRECSTHLRKGTHTSYVQRAFRARGIDTHLVELESDLPFWLEPLSNHFPLYVVVREKRRRTTHAIAVAEGLVYDGHNQFAVPLDIYFIAHKIEKLLVVDRELPNYGKNQ